MDVPVPREWLEQMGRFLDSEDEALRKRLAERWASKDADRDRIVQRLADEAVNPCAEVQGYAGINYADPTRPDHLLDALPAGDSNE